MREDTSPLREDTSPLREDTSPIILYSFLFSSVILILIHSTIMNNSIVDNFFNSFFIFIKDRKVRLFQFPMCSLNALVIADYGKIRLILNTCYHSWNVSRICMSLIVFFFFCLSKDFYISFNFFILSLAISK